MQGGTSSPLPEPPSCPGRFGSPSARRFASGVRVRGLGKINSHTGRSPCLRRPRVFPGAPAIQLVPGRPSPAGVILPGGAVGPFARGSSEMTRGRVPVLALTLLLAGLLLGPRAALGFTYRHASG